MNKTRPKFYSLNADQKRHWDKLRKEALEKAGYKCSHCGGRPDDLKKLHCHHKTYERQGHELLEDVEILCVHCHGRETGRVKRTETIEHLKEIFDENLKNGERQTKASLLCRERGATIDDIANLLGVTHNQASLLVFSESPGQAFRNMEPEKLKAYCEFLGTMPDELTKTNSTSFNHVMDSYPKQRGV